MLVVGFFFLGQIVLPIGVSLIRNTLVQNWISQGVNISLSSGRITAITTAIVYLLMAIASILVLYFSIRPFLPLPDNTTWQVSRKDRGFGARGACHKPPIFAL